MFAAPMAALYKLENRLARWRKLRRLRKQREAVAQRRAGKHKHEMKRYRLMYAQIGQLTVSWASLDKALDALLFTIHIFDGIPSPVQRDVPVSLKAKLASLRKAARVLPALAPLADEFNAVADEVQRLKLIRHDCTHGSPALADKGF